MSNGKMQGEYIRDMLLAMTAATAAGQHIAIIGAPGFGKTRVARLFGQKVFNGKMVFLRFDPSTPPEAVKGYTDIEALMGDHPQYRTIYEGTAYDLNARFFVLDEWWRAMNAVFDSGIDVLDRLEIDPIYAPICVATANFVSQDERTDAVRERFGLTVWLEKPRLNWREIARQHMLGGGKELEVDYQFPTEAEVEFARAAQPTEKSMAAVDDVLAILLDEMNKAGNGFTFEPNPRRIEQWTWILYRTTVLRTGTDDFDTVHKDAITCLRWAWPAKSEKEARAWQEICSAIVDPLQTAIDSVFQQAHERMREIAPTITDKVGKAVEMGKVIDQAQRSLWEFARQRGMTDQHGKPTDPRFERTIGELQTAMAEILTEA